MQVDKNLHQGSFHQRSSQLSIMPIVKLFGILLEWDIGKNKVAAAQQHIVDNSKELK